MGIKVSSLYNDVLQQISKENGTLTITDFNRFSKRAENFFLDWVTGRVQGDVLPQMYVTQKTKDFVSPLIKPFKTSLDSDGRITKPDDYFVYENIYALYMNEENVCEDDVDLDCDKSDVDNKETVGKVSVTLLDGDKFTKRLDSKIKGLAPSIKKPIAKEVGMFFEFAPKEIGGVVLEYVSYPIYAEAVGVVDPIYYTEVISETLSTNYQWGEYARNYLIYIIVDMWSNSVRERAQKEFNTATNKQLTP